MTHISQFIQGKANVYTFLLHALIEPCRNLLVYLYFEIKKKKHVSLLYKSRVCRISVLYPVFGYIKRPWWLLEAISIDSICITTVAGEILRTWSSQRGWFSEHTTMGTLHAAKSYDTSTARQPDWRVLMEEHCTFIFN